MSVLATRRAFLAANCRKANEQRRSLSHGGEKLPVGVLGHRWSGANKMSVGSRPFRVNHPLRDPFAIEMRHLFK